MQQETSFSALKVWENWRPGAVPGRAEGAYSATQTTNW